MPVPTEPEVKTYLEGRGVNYSAAEIRSALQAETAAQAAVCRVSTYTADLAEALKRRVHRNLAMRALPLGLQSDDMGAVRVGGTDPEVRRLEGPYRKRVLG
ncbi:MAG: hypothetical protein P1U38_09840 [Aeromicrobium sp.]|uniref:hypothetical protein n=1 Tax=Aeromicrobium sp. TaxID=1871063 RepID=UPI00263981F3|nr:hypothetical protein [Aeromicrobium sp.]MDF1705063.1 hypothetical protein [Aeromicrobium sp.]